MSKTPIQPLDLFELQSASEIQIAPSRQWLVYVRHSFDINSDAPCTRLWRMNIDGSEHRPLTGDKAQESAPRIAPDGQSIAFLSAISGLLQIHVYDIAAETNRQLTEGLFPPSQPSWSPDSTHIAYFAPAPARPQDFGSISSAPEDAQWAEPPQIITRMPYKIDKLGYLPHIFQQLQVVSVENGTTRQITDGEFDHIVSLAPQNPVWTPDGSELLICTNPAEQTELSGRRSQLYAVSVSNGSLRCLVDIDGGIYHSAISPDGRRIAFLGFRDNGECHPQFTLFAMNADGAGITELAQGLDRSIGESLDNGGAPLQFSEDGQAVFAMYSDQGSTRLARFTLDGDYRVVADDLGSGLTAYAAQSSFGLLDDGALIFNRAIGDQLPELYRQDAGGNSAAPLTDINSALRETRQVGSVEEFYCENPEDAWRIQAWLIRPPDADFSKPLPLILDIHGGPHADYGNRFWLRDQSLAAAGYAVLLVNPRGSTGYGHAFTRGIEHCYPGPDVGDLLAAVEHCVEQGWADPENCFVMGGSGGGTLTAACVSKTDRFRAAACLYPVIDWPTQVLAADVTPFMRHWRAGMPWEVPDDFWQHSLLREVDKVTTPTIVMCGSDDHRTPFGQAEMFFQALKFCGVETALVRFNGESHGMSNRPSHTVQTVELVLNWFRKYR